MQKILTALLTIIFLQLQVYSFPICAVAFSKCDLNLLTTKNECNARQKYSKGTKEPEIRPTSEYYLNPVEQNISLFADIDLMSVSNTVNGIITKIVSGAKATEAIREQANINVAESYSNIGNPQERLADLVFSNSLVESANRDLDNGRYITGTIKGLIATTQTALIFTGLGESVAGIRTVAGTSGYNAVATNATRETKLLSDGAISKYPEASKYQYNAFTNPGPLAKIGYSGYEPIKNFYGGYYNKIITNDDTFIYRMGLSGALNSNNPNLINNAYGKWFTYKQSESIIKTRIDSAVREQWINTKGEFIGKSILESTYKMQVPRGTTLYIGPTATQGGVNLGGKDCLQIFVENPKKSGILPIDEIEMK